MTEGVAWSAFQFVAQVGVGIVGLWLISLHTRSPKATIKTAAIFVAIMTVIAVILPLVFGLVGVQFSLLLGPIFLVASVCIPVYLLMRLYEIHLAPAIGVFVVMYVVNSAVAHLASKVG